MQHKGVTKIVAFCLQRILGRSQGSTWVGLTFFSNQGKPRFSWFPSKLSVDGYLPTPFCFPAFPPQQADQRKLHGKGQLSLHVVKVSPVREESQQKDYNFVIQGWTWNSVLVSSQVSSLKLVQGTGFEQQEPKPKKRQRLGLTIGSRSALSCRNV